jgi:hypothetical protein
MRRYFDQAAIDDIRPVLNQNQLVGSNAVAARMEGVTDEGRRARRCSFCSDPTTSSPPYYVPRSQSKSFLPLTDETKNNSNTRAI